MSSPLRDRSASTMPPARHLDDNVLIGVDADGSAVAWLVRENEKLTLTTAQLTALADAGFLRVSGQRESRPLPDHWTAPEALVHMRASLGWPRPEPSSRARPADQEEPASSSGSDMIRLGEPPASKGRLMASVLRRRRSAQSVCGPLALDDLSALLQVSCGSLEDPEVPGRAHRPYPTAGGADELSFVVVAANVTDLRPGAHRYHPDWRSLERLQDPAGSEFSRENSERACTYLGLGESSAPAALIVVNAVWPRILSRYSDVGMLSAYCDAGALLQTMYLVAADLGLPCTAVSSLNSARNAQILGVDPLRESQVACFALGGPAG